MSRRDWDLVVLTAIDESQKLSYEKQIEFYLNCGSVPDVKFRVYSDEPTGVKIGNGGGTLIALWKLYEEFGEALLCQRILLLNAGGLCQRQPNASVCGKIFSLLPTAGTQRPNPVLSLKCRLYQPILNRMPPGVFIAAADALEYLGLSEEKWEISPTGFTVLAHPSRLDIAVNHGVYIFNSEDLGKHLSAGGATTIPVTKVLQKPSRQQLESESAIVHNSTAVKPYAYTDSAYFMGSDVVQKLLALRTSLSPLCCEIDAYGDFLQCLGTRGSPEYISDTKNVLVESDQLAIVRRLIYDTLHDSKAEALVLNNSAFYHIGTFKELLEHFCGDELFLERFSLAHKSFCCFPKSKSKILNPQSKIDGSVAFSVLAKDSATHEHSYVEFSHFPCGIEVGKNSIVSNCSTAGKETCRIPPSTFISTFALESAVSKGEVLYSTVIFNTFDNLKLKKFSAVELPFYLGTLGSSCTSLGVKIENVFDSNTKEFSLWNAKLFPTAATMDESFQLGLKMIQLLTTNNSEINSIGSNLVSMADILAFKHFDSLLNYRQQLYNLIKNP